MTHLGTRDEAGQTGHGVPQRAATPPAAGGLVTIGKSARRADVSVETIRFYEREELLPLPARDPSSGYRRYPDSTVARLRFIARAKELGFTLRETRELLDLRYGDGDCATVRAHAQAKLAQVRSKILDLQRIEAALERLAARCPGAGAAQECPILTALEGEPPSRLDGEQRPKKAPRSA